MKIKLIQPNSYGRLEFSIEELEELLKETYNEGYVDGARSSFSTGSITGNGYYPSITYLTNSTEGTLDSNTVEVALG